jgi:hypothetical protein
MLATPLSNQIKKVSAAIMAAVAIALITVAAGHRTRPTCLYVRFGSVVLG